MYKINELEYDYKYENYIGSGEAEAVWIVKDVVKKINTKGKWIDVISLNTYEKKGAKGKTAYNWIIVELFPRTIHPKYVPNNRKTNRYLTWVASHEDIEKQRKEGVHGKKYLILCNLYNRNKNKFTTHNVVAKKYWEPQGAYRQMEVKNPVEPVWEYHIHAVKEVNHKQVSYIIENEYELVGKIRENGKPTLEILGL